MKTITRISGVRVQVLPKITSPINPGTAASFTASHLASSESRPIAPVSSVLTTPSAAIQLTLRRCKPSHKPQTSGKARASSRA